MKYKPFRFRLSTGAVLLVAGVLVFFTLTALAQSGRRAKKSTPLPPVPTPEASPTPTPSKSREQVEIPILLGANSMDAFGNIPSYFKESVARSCGDRLRQRSFLVELSSRELMGPDARKRAKEAKEGYVVLLELRSDKLGSDRDASELSMIYLDYAVYAAVTGKQITAGSIRQQAGLTDVIAGGGSSVAVTERRLKNAAQVAADRIFAVVLKQER